MSLCKSRMTKQKQWIAGALTSHPRSVEEIFIHLKKNHCQVDKTTIYRNLQKLVAEGLVTATQFADNVTKYELANCVHHHHIICTQCGYIEDIQLDENLLTESVRKHTTFGAISHRLEFFGVCKDCK